MFSFLPNSRYFGIHISHHAVTAAYLGSFGTPKIHGVGVAKLERNPWLKNGLRDKETLAKAIATATSEAQPHSISLTQAICTLPESTVFTKVIKLPKLSRKELLQTIPFEAADALPLPLEEVYLDWQINEIPGEGHEKAKLRILVVAAPKHIVDDLTDTMASAGIELVCVESEPFSVARSVQHLLSSKAASIICTISEDTTTTTVATREHIKLTSTLQVGRRKLKQSQKEATLKIAEEINENIKYYRNRLGEQEPIHSVILTGEGALTPELSTTIEKLVKIPCHVGYAPLRLPDGSAIHPKFNTVLGTALWKKSG